MAYVKTIILSEDASLPELPAETKSYLDITYNTKGVNYNKINLYTGEDITEVYYRNPNFNILTDNEIEVQSLQELINFMSLL